MNISVYTKDSDHIKFLKLLKINFKFTIIKIMLIILDMQYNSIFNILIRHKIRKKIFL